MPGRPALPPASRKAAGDVASQSEECAQISLHALYDKVYRGDVLWHAYHCCRLNDGAAGVDGQTFEDIVGPRRRGPTKGGAAPRNV
jgi:hypothetical protein